MKLFVYGTLKRREGRSGVLSDCRFLGPAFLAEWNLHSLKSFPTVDKSADAGTGVHGELYEIDKDVLALTDMIEGYPHYYTRDTVLVSIDDGLQEALVYYIPRPWDYEFPQIVEGVW